MLIPKSLIRRSCGQEITVENLTMEPHMQARLLPYVNRLAQEQMERDL